MAKKSRSVSKGGRKVTKGRVEPPRRHVRCDAGGQRIRRAAERRERERLAKLEKEQEARKAFAITDKLDNMPISPLNIQGYGKLSFPVYSEDVLVSLRKVMTKSKYGLGVNDVYDEKVRVSWELKDDKFTIANPAWDTYLTDTIMPNITEKLGCDSTTTRAVLDKFLLYEKGSFFLKHVDSVKEPGNFGTLVIQLPSDYSGGRLICDHKKMTKMIVDHSSEDGNFEKQFSGFYTAFYLDVEHEVSKVISGVRSCLVYKLVDTSKCNAASSSKKPIRKTHRHENQQHQNRLASD